MDCNFTGSATQTSLFDCPRSDLFMKLIDLAEDEKETPLTSSQTSRLNDIFSEYHPSYNQSETESPPLKRARVEKNCRTHNCITQETCYQDESLCLEQKQSVHVLTDQQLIQSVQKGQWDVILKFIDYTYDLFRVRSIAFHSPIFKSVINTIPDFSYVLNIPIPNREGGVYPLLYWAAKSRQWNIISKILFQQTNIESYQKPANLESPCFLALKDGQYLLALLFMIKKESVRELIKAFFQGNQSVTGDQIIQIFRTSAVDELCFDLEIFSDRREIDFLMLYALLEKESFCFEILIKMQSNVNQLIVTKGFPSGITPFWYAIAKKVFDKAEWMIPYSPDVNFFPKEGPVKGVTAFQLALAQNPPPYSLLEAMMPLEPNMNYSIVEGTSPIVEMCKRVSDFYKLGPQIKKYHLSISSREGERCLRVLWNQQLFRSALSHSVISSEQYTSEEELLIHGGVLFKEILFSNPPIPSDLEYLLKETGRSVPAYFRSMVVLKWYLANKDDNFLLENRFDDDEDATNRSLINRAYRLFASAIGFYPDFTHIMLADSYLAWNRENDNHTMRNAQKILYWIYKFQGKSKQFFGEVDEDQDKLTPIEKSIKQIDETPWEEFSQLGQKDFLTMKYMVSFDVDLEKQLPRSEIKNDLIKLLYRFQKTLQNIYAVFGAQKPIHVFSNLPYEIKLQIAYEVLLAEAKELIFYSPELIRGILHRILCPESKFPVVMAVERLVSLLCVHWENQHLSNPAYSHESVKERQSRKWRFRNRIRTQFLRWVETTIKANSSTEISVLMTNLNVALTKESTKLAFKQELDRYMKGPNETKALDKNQIAKVLAKLNI